MENNWRQIWNKRRTDIDNFAELDDKDLVMELKRLDGFDIDENAVSYEAFVEECDKTITYLFKESAKMGGGQYI